MQVLIFGKDKNSLQWVGKQIVASGMEIRSVHVTTLSETEMLLKSMYFDVILYDLTLPVYLVRENVQSLLELGGKIPLVILTGVFTLPVAVEAVKMGAEMYLVKDKAGSALLASCLEVIKKKKLQAVKNEIQAECLYYERVTSKR